MSKVIAALAILLVLVCLAIGGVYLYQNLDFAKPASATQDDSVVDEEKAGKGKLGRMKKAATPSDIPSLLTYAMEKSLDAVGWLDVPGTEISQVVMQGSDNLYYERRDEDGNEDIYGCYFLDAECSLGRSTDFLPNTVIYGHSDLKDNPDGPRFSQLFRFVDDAFAKENRYMNITTMEGRFSFEIFSVFYTDTSFDYIRVHMTPEEALTLATQVKEKSIRDYGVTPVAGDRLLTLSTCSVRDGNDGTHRFAVMGRLVQEEPVQVPSTVQEEETPLAPPAASEAPGAQSQAGETSSQPAPVQPAQPVQPGQPTAPVMPDVQVPQFDFQQPEIAQPQIPDIPQIQPNIPGV